MTTTTIRIPEEDYKKVKALAAFEGVSVSEFMRNAIMEQVEDTLDYEAGINVLNEKNERVAREDVLKEVFPD
ncbi:type II toxin-antitoxin system RelB family antitoxin [Enterococcus sp. AZ109]|uniref:type II toxin-antitoxin system RelB family antitoxin n=1 Tax=Enterococcus sp. AZ109 TaxID=2774634 RepID=UPI003F23080F